MDGDGGRMARVRVNLNDHIRARLSAHGIAVLEREGRVAQLRQRGDLTEDGVLTMQAWDFFHVFGPHLWMGNTKLPFASMDVELEIASGPARRTSAPPTRSARRSR